MERKCNGLVSLFELWMWIKLPLNHVKGGGLEAEDWGVGTGGWGSEMVLF